ncbi:MAG: response regulator transcription factor [Gammaproteobacteria bacterium]|nr:LytTR family DNA-binding domain-containing protein [Gammaproteobacteria bacterium]MDE2024435.1 response regulator transcription factor [Gammaproteobacteria bacterium]MDE2274651.1 response regulator transcription factor [Gammaproteobacteria bacterium]
MKIRTLIVDDMPLSRERTRRYLAEVEDVEIVGECADGERTLAAIDKLAPDLLLLDVQMPGMTGLALLEKIPAPRRPAVVFVTAFDEFAVPAFAAHAVDFLLKPFDRERLTQVLKRVREYLAERHLQPPAAPAAESASAPAFLTRIAVKSVGRTVFVNSESVDWLETAGNYVCLHAGKDTHVVRETMNQLETQLDPAKFVRIHRSTMVRIEAIREIQPLFNGDRVVILHDGSKLTLSRSYRDRVRVVLGAI